MTAFGADYFEDRRAFRELAARNGWTLDVHAIAARGPDDEELTVDVARFGAAEPKTLLVVISGVHGVEGPAGSALQRQLIADDLPAQRLPDDAAVVLIHAANPFGYAWHRRWNEDNVDLNRNFVDFDAPLPQRHDYAALNDWLNPVELGDPREFQRRGRDLVAARGLPWVHRTLIEGQYDFPCGLYFAGRAPVESNRILQRVFSDALGSPLRERSPDREGMSDPTGSRSGNRSHGGVERALVVDLHTGMGDWGDCLYLPAHDRGTPRFDWLAAHFNSARFVMPTNDDSSPAVPVAGQLSRWLAQRHPQLAYLTVEFGTVGGERMIAAERAENWLFQHGGMDARESETGRAILAEIRETSAPADARWRRRVQVQGAAVLADACRALFERSST